MMKNYKAILFDMDGTLLPMDMKEFTNGYFILLAKKLAPFSIPTDVLVSTIWKGTELMARNDGSKRNDTVFWEFFDKEVPGHDIVKLRACCDEFYGKEFKEAKSFTKDNPLAKEAVSLARKKAPIVALATNPLFPMDGQKTRMEWVGLKPEDFDLVTSYETDSYCKPNPEYFISVCERLNVDPADCLMIGNDENEDMYACTKAGIDGYLITDTMIPSKEHAWNGPKGSFRDMMGYLNNLN